jgi:hypothetical protein
MHFQERLIREDFVNDQRFREQKALILQAAMARSPDTLFEHRRQKVNKDKG